jgi:hypothetical protein
MQEYPSGSGGLQVPKYLASTSAGKTSGYASASRESQGGVREPGVWEENLEKESPSEWVKDVFGVFIKSMLGFRV